MTDTFSLFNMRKHAPGALVREIKRIVGAYYDNDSRELNSICEKDIGLICKYASFISAVVPLGKVLIRMRMDLSGREDLLISQGCWYPYEKSAIGQGRFNKQGQGMAYFCFDTNTAVCETNKAGEKLKERYELRCSVRHADINVLVIMPIQRTKDFEKNQLFEHVSRLNLHRRDRPEMFEAVYRATRFVGDVVSDDNESVYPLTNEIARCLFEMHDIDGIVYPSVQTDLRYNNVVLKPEVADEFVKPDVCIGVDVSAGAVTCVLTYGGGSTGRSLWGEGVSGDSRGMPIQWLEGVIKDGCSIEGDPAKRRSQRKEKKRKMEERIR